MKPYTTKSFNYLDQPTPLPISLRIEFRFEDHPGYYDCSACSIRELHCEKSGETVLWLHCKVTPTDEAKSGERVSSKVFLIPLRFITRAYPGSKIIAVEKAPANREQDIGVFPAHGKAPDDPLPLGEIQRALAYCQNLRAAAPLTGRMYSDFVGNMSRQFEAALRGMEAVYNFEHGDEFEVALCRVLRAILPQRFGICRGYVLNSLGETAGNDIIIFDRMRFPTFRGLAENDYSLREQVPIEAVYAYIEAKHTLDIEGDHGTSLAKAFQQVSDVKMCCAHRQDVTFEETIPYTGFKLDVSIEVPKGWPKYRNPIYGAVISKNVRLKRGGNTESDPEIIMKAMANKRIQFKRPPDLIVAGRNNLLMPSMPADGPNKRSTPSPFFIEWRNYGAEDYASECSLQLVKVNSIAFGVGLGMMLWALDWIQLGEMPWPEVLTNAVKPFCDGSHDHENGERR